MWRIQNDFSILNATAFFLYFLYFLYVSFAVFLLFFHFKVKTVTSSTTGNITADKIPLFKSEPSASDTMPTTVGPTEQPMSPARARNANIAVPPVGIAEDAMLKVPGHRIPTEKPHKAQPIRPSTGFVEKDASR